MRLEEFDVRAELLFDNYWNHIVYERYEERIIKHRAGIPVESLNGKDVYVRSGRNKRRDGAERWKDRS